MNSGPSPSEAWVEAGGVLVLARGGAGEEVAEPVIEPVDREDADREKGEQLHQRLEGHRQHDAAVMLGGVDLARGVAGARFGLRRRGGAGALPGSDRLGHRP